MDKELTLRSTVKVCGGQLAFYSHASEVCGCPMNFSVFLPAKAQERPVPALYWLSGLTCTDENFMIKAAAWRYAAQYGLILIAPDTSPRGLNLPGEDDHWDFGSGAGFYLNATQEPWSDNYRMYDYIVHELPSVVNGNFPVDTGRIGISGHSMGGHGALSIAQKNQKTYRSVSAFAPICAPMQCPWGQKAFENYLGSNQDDWRQYDTCEILRDLDTALPMLVDQGSDDSFLDRELMPHKLEEVCNDKGFNLELHMRDGYDHSYYFIATFIGDHIAWHANHLND